MDLRGQVVRFTGRIYRRKPRENGRWLVLLIPNRTL